MSKKFIDLDGLTYLWEKMRLKFATRQDITNILSKKVTIINSDSMDDTYPSSKAVWTLADSKIAKDKVGEGLAIDEDGVLSALAKEVPIATKTVKGVVKVGSGLDVDTDGTLRLDAYLDGYQTTDNLVQELNAGSTADTYPSAKATWDYIELLMDTIAHGSY